jgi:hydroxymethylglutaryl-CoA lyase
MPETVRIVEVGPRDGLQNEARVIPTAAKVRLVDLLSACGFATIEVTSFVAPRWVPQLADAAKVMAAIRRAPDTRYTALTPNLEGYRRALAAGADAVAVFASASEGFSQHNINCGIAQSFARFRPVALAAQADGVPLRGYVSCVTACPYDGPTAPEKVAEVTAALLELGCHEISLGDTLGVATPEAIAAMLDAVLRVAPANRLAGHYHDTHGLALANVDVSLERGLHVFDASIGGLGGCPYAPGAAGNLATGPLARHLTDLGHATGLDHERLEDAASFARQLGEPARR